MPFNIFELLKTAIRYLGKAPLTQCPQGGFRVRIIKYLKSSKVAVILITLLLIVQAFADLSLPRYTSDLVDVGIQQGGIEHASPDEMSADTFNYI